MVFICGWTSGFSSAGIRQLAAVAVALTLLACGGGGGDGGGGDGGNQSETAFGGPAADLMAIVGRISEGNTANTAVMRVSFRNIPDNAVHATCLFQLEDGDKHASYGSDLDYQFVDNGGPVISAENADADGMEINCGHWDAVSGAAASRSPEVSIKVRWDADDEGDETIRITLKAATFYDSTDRLLARARIFAAIASIIIGDEPPVLAHRLSADTDAIDEDGGVATVTLTLNRDVPDVVPYLMFPYTITGIQADDITASLTGAIMIPAGDNTGTVTITAQTDTLDEGEGETMIIRLDAPPDATGEDPLMASITIIDDDGSTGIPPVSVSMFHAVPSSIAENGGEATLTLVLNSIIPPGDPDLVFFYAIDGVDSADITAPDLTNGSITVAADSDTGTATITGLDDDRTEGDETMRITLMPLPNNARGATITADDIDPVRITITDDDIPPVSVARFYALPTAIAENGGEATLTLVLNSIVPRGDPALVFFYAIDGVDDTDITAPDLTNGSITVAAGSDTGTATITGLDDDRTEGDETMRITLTPLPDNAGGATITADGIDPVRITITDDESPPAVERFTLSPEDTGITLARRPLLEGGVDAEGGGRISVAVGLTKAAVEDVKLTIRIEPDAGAYMCVGAGTADRIACMATAMEMNFTIEEGALEFTREFLFNAANPGLNGLDDPETLTFSVSFPDGNVSIDDAELVRSVAVNYRAPTAICDSVMTFTDTDTNNVRFTTSDVRETLAPGPVMLERTAALSRGDNFFHAYRIVLAGAGRLTAETTDGGDPGVLLDMEASFLTAPTSPRTQCTNLAVPDVNYMHDIDIGGDNYNFRFEDTLSAGTYYLIVYDYEFFPGEYGLQITFTPAANAEGNAAAATLAGQQRRLVARVRALTLSTAERQTDMIRDLVRRRTGGGASDGITLNAPPDEGGMDELADLARSSLSVQQSVRGEDGGRYSLWAASAGTSGAHAGFEWASADGRDIHGVAMSLSSPALAFAAAGAGLTDSAGWTWPGAWNEDMVLLAPYLGRRSAAMEVWATSGFGLGEIRLDGGTADAAADARIMFLQTGAAWRKTAPSGPQADLTVQGVAVRKDVSGFRLGDYAVPSVGAGIFRVSAAASLSWPLPLSGGIMRPGLEANVSGDFADVLPGRVRRNAGWTLGLSWTRGTLTAAVEGSGESGDAGFLRRGLGGDLRGSLRVSPARGLDLGVELRKHAAFGRDDVGGGHTARFTLRQTF